MISDAYAQAAPAAGGGTGSLFMLIAFAVIFYFILIRPQQKRLKTHQAMVTQLKAGDEVVTGGGVLGKINAIEDSLAVVEIAEGVKIKVQKHTITTVVPKGTL